jgi:hypothetical protein
VGDIKREKLKRLVWIRAHNDGKLTDETQRAIDAFDPPTYRQLLEIQLAERKLADRNGTPGGGTASAAYLQEALDNLEYILSKD